MRQRRVLHEGKMLLGSRSRSDFSAVRGCLRSEDGHASRRRPWNLRLRSLRSMVLHFGVSAGVHACMGDGRNPTMVAEGVLQNPSSPLTDYLALLPTVFRR